MDSLRRDVDTSSEQGLGHHYGYRLYAFNHQFQVWHDTEVQYRESERQLRLAVVLKLTICPRAAEQQKLSFLFWSVSFKTMANSASAKSPSLKIPSCHAT